MPDALFDRLDIKIQKAIRAMDAYEDGLVEDILAVLEMGFDIDDAVYLINRLNARRRAETLELAA